MAWYGLDPATGRWGHPIRQRWGLSSHQQMSPGLEDKLAFTLTATSAYEEAAAVARKWGCAVEDSTLHALAQRLGARAEQQQQQRLNTLASEGAPGRAASELAVFMLDGWQARYRGPGWGKKRTRKNRVEWHEMKLGVFYLAEQSARTASGRGMLTDKVVIAWQGEPAELGRRLHWEALRRGLGPEQAKEWVEARLHELRHGQEEHCLEALAELKPPRGEKGQIVREQQNYFACQSQRMNYHQIAQRGWPIGSGAVESACSGHQNRFKRRGQFWTRPGLAHFAALKQARQNNHWDQLWFVEYWWYRQDAPCAVRVCRAIHDRGRTTTPAKALLHCPRQGARRRTQDRGARRLAAV